MRAIRLIASMAAASVILTSPLAAAAQGLIDGHAWQRSSEHERLAYLAGLSNSISVGALYDSRAGASSSFATRAQRSLANAQIEPTMKAIDTWYRNNPSQLDKPVISVLWAYVALQKAYGR